MPDRDKDLDMLFAEARQAHPKMPDGLANRMMSDALAVMPRTRREGVGWLAQLGEILGGWYGYGGLAAACAAGVWLGFAPPSGVPDPLELLVGTQSGFDLFETDSLALALSEDG